MKKESLKGLIATNEKERKDKATKFQIKINEKDVKEIFEKMKEELNK